MRFAVQGVLGPNKSLSRVLPWLLTHSQGVAHTPKPVARLEIQAAAPCHSQNVPADGPGWAQAGPCFDEILQRNKKAAVEKLRPPWPLARCFLRSATGLLKPLLVGGLQSGKLSLQNLLHAEGGPASSKGGRRGQNRWVDLMRPSGDSF